MKEHDAIEQAYKNGFADAEKKTAAEIESLSIELQAMRNAANAYKNDAERFKGVIKILEADIRKLIPCKIGDSVWAIRNYKGVAHPQKGVVTDMYFSRDMRLCIVVKHIARGEWGKKIFPSQEAAEAALRGGGDE